MSFQIGRIGLDITFDPTDVMVRGNNGQRIVTVTGELAADSADEAKSLRNELWRMTENEDLVVPVISSADSSLDGFYKVLDASIAIQSISLEGWYPFQCQLEAFGSEGRVAIESRIVGGLRTNDHGITLVEAAPFHALPDPYIGYQGYSIMPALMTRTGVDGSIRVWRDVVTSVSPVWSIPAADFYDDAAKVEVGSTLRVLAGLDAENLPGDWRISNGLVRVTPNATNGRLDIQIYDGSTWESLETFEVIADSEVGAWSILSVLRNDAAAVIIRLFQRLANDGDWVSLDLTLRRGSMFVEGRITTHTDATIGVDHTSGTAAVSVQPSGASSAVAIERASNDGNGHRWALGSSMSHAQDIANGTIHKATCCEFTFFLGFAKDGSSAVDGDRTRDLCLQYLGYLTEYLNPVLR